MNIEERAKELANNEKSISIQDNNNVDTIVNCAFDSATKAVIENNKEKQEKIIDTAGKVIDNKLNKFKSDAEAEDKSAYFKANVDACECFGYAEKTTEKWAVKCMKMWHNLFTFLWIIIASVSVAPIVFLAKKVKVVFKKTIFAVIIAIIIYALFIFVPIIIGNYLS